MKRQHDTVTIANKKPKVLTQGGFSTTKCRVLPTDTLRIILDFMFGPLRICAYCKKVDHSITPTFDLNMEWRDEVVGICHHCKFIWEHEQNKLYRKLDHWTDEVKMSGVGHVFLDTTKKADLYKYLVECMNAKGIEHSPFIMSKWMITGDDRIYAISLDIWDGMKYVYKGVSFMCFLVSRTEVSK